MYQTHFGLTELPFGLTPDTSYFFAASSSQAALNTLLIACRAGEGFIKITGEVGTGKTMLCRKFLACMQDPFVTAYIPNPALDAKSLMLALAEELGLQLPQDVMPHQLSKAIHHQLLQLALAGKRIVLCIDEAQAMPLATLEALRLLTNLETEKRKLLQIVLFGQPELDRKLSLPEIRQLAQRISFQYALAGLSLIEMQEYLRHRLQVAKKAGKGDCVEFAPDAIRMLHAASAGVPRLVNILAHKSLMLAFGGGQKTILPGHMQAAIADTPAARQGMGWSGWLAPLWQRIGTGFARLKTRRGMSSLLLLMLLAPAWSGWQRWWS